MMYLVLTALLALNVQKEVLNAFVIVDEGISKMNENYNEKNSKIYDEFNQAVIENPRKAGKWNEIALKVKKQADELYEMIQDLKIEIVNKSEKQGNPAVVGREIKPMLIGGKENADIPGEIMIVKGNGKKLKGAIESFRKYLLEQIDPKAEGIKSAIEISLHTADPEPVDGKMESWESEHFEHLPLVGVTTILTGLQSNIRNAESDILRYLYTMIDKGSFKFNKLEATVIPVTNYVIQGNEYQAKVFIAAFDTTQNPSIKIGPYDSIRLDDGTYTYSERKGYKYDSLVVVNGKGVVKRMGSTVGYTKLQGIVKLKAPEGGVDLIKPFRLDYQVAEPMLVVSPTKMNVFYLGVDNPVEISVPSVGADKVFPGINNGTIVKEGKGYIVRPSKAGSAQVSVLVEIEKAKKNMGTKDFRVKILPNPTAKVAGISGGGGIDKNVLLAQAGVIAELENVDFDAPFKVTEFTVSTVIGGFTTDKFVKSNKFSPEQLGLIKQASRGQKIYIESIKAIGPDGTTRQLGSIALSIK